VRSGRKDFRVWFLSRVRVKDSAYNFVRRRLGERCLLDGWRSIVRMKGEWEKEVSCDW
jgi:hypothetical protein